MPELTATSEETRVYEICVLIPHPLSQKEEKELLKNVEDILEEAGGKQIAKDVWGRRGLAYPIGGFTEGNFIVYHYEFDPNTINSIDEHLRIAKNVLRHLVIKPPKGYQIIKYSKKYDEWLEEKETAEETRQKQKEEDLKHKMLEKQKRQAPKKPISNKKAVDKIEEQTTIEKDLTKEIDKLIADDELEL